MTVRPPIFASLPSARRIILAQLATCRVARRTGVVALKPSAAMVPEKQWRDKGSNMDKRTARKVHRVAFQQTISSLRSELLKNACSVGNGSRLAVHPMAIAPPPAPLCSTANSLMLQEPGNDHIHVYVRKRPLLPHEAEKKEFDVVTVKGKGEVIVHDCKMYPDMKHKFVESYHHKFSKCYDENVQTDQIYLEATKHLLLHAMRGGKSVCMMYGQTGSGKTYTMGGFFEQLAEDLFTEPVGTVDFAVSVGAVEIVGTKCYDLLRQGNMVPVCEDADQNTKLLNLSETEADSISELIQVLEEVKELRSTESTSVNSTSSRSHLVVYIFLRRRDPQKSLYGQLILLDLAGSERNEDTFHHDAARRKETIEINKSHLAIKQCIRAIGNEDASGYVPYRASTLTRILKDSLWAKDSRASVIANISPISTDTEHTLHTLLCAGQMLEDNPLVHVEKVDVKEAGEDQSFVPIREWTNAAVCEWFAKLRNGAFEKYVDNLGNSVNGRLLVRFSTLRFTQICNGNVGDADFIYKALRNEMAKNDKLDRERRARNMARRK